MFETSNITRQLSSRLPWLGRHFTRKTHSNLLASNTHTLQARVLENLREGIIWFDKDAEIVEMNIAAIDMMARIDDADADFLHRNDQKDKIPRELREFLTNTLSARRNGEFEEHASITCLGFIFDVHFTGRVCEPDKQFETGVMRLHDMTPSNSTARIEPGSESDFKRLYEETPSIMHSVDHHGRILSVSDRWLKVLGYKREEILGRPTREIMSEESIARLPDILLLYFQQGYIENVPYTYFRSDGKPIDFLVSSVAQRAKDGRIFRSNTVMQEVSELKKLESELAETNAFRALLFQQALNGIITTDKSGIILTCNDEACRIFNQGYFSIIGCSIFELFSTPEYENHLIEDWIASPDKKICEALEVRIRRSINSLDARINLKMSRFMLKDTEFLLFTTYDVTETVRNRIELDRWKNIVEDSLAIIEDGFAIFDKNNELMIFNDSAIRLFELEDGMMKAGDALESILAKVSSRGTFGGEQQQKAVTGEILRCFDECANAFETRLASGRWLRLSTRQMSSGRKVTIASDISEHRTLLAELAERNRILSRVNSDLANYLRLASHDLKSPLRSILSALQLLQHDLADTSLAASTTDMLSSLVGLAHTAQVLLEDMQTYARIGLNEDIVCETHINALIDDIRRSTIRAGVRVDVAIVEHVRMIMTPAASLRRVLENLMLNADIHNHRLNRRIWISCIPAGTDRIEITVRDNGPGIPTDRYEDVFTPLVRLSDPGTGGGSGMGLAIARRIVESYDGRIWIDVPGMTDGTIVKFTWPSRVRAKGRDLTIVEPS